MAMPKRLQYAEAMALKNVFSILTGTALGAMIGAAAGALVGCGFGVGAELGYGPLIFSTWLFVGTVTGAFFGALLKVAKLLDRASEPKP